MKQTQLRWRFWLESILGSASLGMALLTAVWHDWIELVFRTNPDQGSGLLEWAVAAGLALLAGLMGMLARFEWRRRPTAASMPALGVVDTSGDRA